MSTTQKYHYIRETQPGSELFTFVVTAEDLIGFAKIDRFNEVDEGVERKLNYSHVLELVEFMCQPNAFLAEPILGDLRGSWEFNKEQQVIHWREGAVLCVDDGQHRIASLHLLESKERERWEFKITATVNTPYQTRLQRFVQQLKRLRIDTHLLLQIMERGNLFPDQTSKMSYQLAKRLATDSLSPLSGLIRLEEQAPRKQPVGTDWELLKPIIGSQPAVALRKDTLDIINVKGIIRDVRQMTASVHSLLRSYDGDRQFLLIVALLDGAKVVWPAAWNDPRQFFLRRAAGIGALLQLFVVGRTFKDRLQKQLKKDLLQFTPDVKEEVWRTINHARKYDWSYARFRAPGIRFPSPTDIARELDSAIYHEGGAIGSRRKAGS